MSFDANQNLPTPAPLTVCSGFDPLTSHDACLIEKGADPRRKGTKLDYTGWFPLWCCEIVGRVGNSLQDVPYDCPRRTKGPRSYSTHIHDFAIRPSSRSARFYKLICQINFYDFHDLINSRNDFRISGSRTKNTWLYSRLITSRSLVRTRMRVWQRDSRLKLARCGGVSGSVPRRCDYHRDLGSRMLRGPCQLWSFCRSSQLDTLHVTLAATAACSCHVDWIIITLCVFYASSTLRAIRIALSHSSQLPAFLAALIDLAHWICFAICFDPASQLTRL